MCGGWGFWAPMAGCDGSVILVAVSRDVWGLWILTLAGGGWIVSPGRLRDKNLISDLFSVFFPKLMKLKSDQFLITAETYTHTQSLLMLSSINLNYLPMCYLCRVCNTLTNRWRLGSSSWDGGHHSWKHSCRACYSRTGLWTQRDDMVTRKVSKCIKQYLHPSR